MVDVEEAPRVIYMTADELARRLAGPIQLLGASFYFDASTAERAQELGLNVYEFYGLGRGGVLGDVDVALVQDAFYFFHPRTVAFLYDAPRAKAGPVAVAAAYLDAAYAFADRTFGALSRDALARLASAAHRVATATPRGRYPLADGYANFEPSSDVVHDAYWGAVYLRELRGGVHVEAVGEVGLLPVEACYLQDESIFKLHGYSDEDVPVVTPELEAKKREAEVLTNEKMAALLEVLDDTERENLFAGVTAMAEALAHPVAR